MPTRTDYDVYWCSHCKSEWTVASLPHNPKCPACGRGGWFRRFLEGAAYEVTYAHD